MPHPNLVFPHPISMHIQLIAKNSFYTSLCSQIAQTLLPQFLCEHHLFLPLTQPIFRFKLHHHPVLTSLSHNLIPDLFDHLPISSLIVPSLSSSLPPLLPLFSHSRFKVCFLYLYISPFFFHFGNGCT